MRSGLRLQIILLLGGLLLLAFVPLFFAIATYTRFTFRELRATSARSLGLAAAEQIAEARAHRDPSELASFLQAYVGRNGVYGVGLYDSDGVSIGRFAEPEIASELPTRVSPSNRALERVFTSRGVALRVVIPSARGPVAVVVRFDEPGAKIEPLIQLFGLYIGVMALTLLVLAYFALTRIIVRPLDVMSRAAERVAGGARHLELPFRAPRELMELGVSIRTMTERLLGEERALRKKIDEVEEATTHLKHAQERLVRSERLASVGRLAAGLAHEIGNPIAAIIGMQDLLLEGGLSPSEQQDFLQRMRKETERINTILRDLLQFARPASAHGPADASDPGNVEAAIFDTVTLVSPQKSMQDMSLDVDVYPDLPNVLLSREQLVQVLLNLLLNAADACNGRGRVSVRARSNDRGVTISVEDDGPGISPDVLQRLFEPFVTTKDVGKGTGLGLAVCRGLVEAVGGTIALDETYEDGARFVVELPVA